MEKEKLVFDWANIKNKKESIKNVFEPLVQDMIKELGDDVIEEIKRLKEIITQNKDE